MRFKKFIIINGRCFERNVIKDKGKGDGKWVRKKKVRQSIVLN